MIPEESTAKFTEGPWEVIDAPDGSLTVGTDEQCVARIVGTNPEARMNARLIAAGPALYETLDGLVSIGKRDMSNPKYDGYFEFARAVLDDIRKGGGS